MAVTPRVLSLLPTRMLRVSAS